MEIVLVIIMSAISGGLFGALVGLLPFYIGKNAGKPNLGKLGWQWSLGVGVLLGPVAFGVAVGFVIAILVKETDYIPANQVIPPQNYGYAPPPPAAAGSGTRMGVMCLSGPMKGQTYSVGPNGMIVGRDNDCAIRFPSNHPGVSRRHCSLRWQGGVLMLTDLGSSHGTFLQNGIQLSPHYPTQLPPDSQFSLANSGIAFRVVII